MVITSIFIVLSVGILAFAIIAKPFNEGVKEEIGFENTLSEADLSALQEKINVWMNDLEMEFTAGKLDEQDFTQQKSILQKEITQLDEQQKNIQREAKNNGEKEIESLITNRRMERMERSAGFCVQCGAPLNTSDVFCSKCGLKLK